MVPKRKENAKDAFENLFLHPKPVKMLVSLRSDNIKYATQVSKSVDCTYSHTVKVLEMFKDMGLVQFEKKGRIKMIKLTDSGTDVAQDFETIRRKFGKIGGNLKDFQPKLTKK